MKHVTRQMILLAALAAVIPLFLAACNFESDGNFSGLVAGLKREIDVTEPPLPLQPPAGVQVTADDFGGILIKWDDVSEADGYNVERASAANPSHFVRRGSSGRETYTDSGSGAPIQPDTPYYYRVTAYNSAEVSEPSATAGPIMAKRNETILDAPENISASAVSNNVTVTWTAVMGAAGYELYRASAFDGNVYIFRFDTSTTSYSDMGLLSGSYTYQVRGYNSAGPGYISHASEPVPVTAGGGLPAPARPQNLRAAASYTSGSAVISVTWNAAANATGYVVYRSVDDELYLPVNELPLSQVTYQDTDINDGEAYYYRVRGYNGTQEGYLSDPYGPVLIRPGKPEVSVSVQDKTITVEWDEVYGADVYYVRRSTDGTNFQSVNARGTGNLSYDDIGLATGTYHYRVEASNSAEGDLPPT